MNLREQILAMQDRPIQGPHKVPEWNDAEVYIRQISARERDAYEQSLAPGGKDEDGNAILDLENIRARLVVLTLVDKEGNRIFAPSDAAALGDKSATALDRLYDLARVLNGLEPAETTKGNSEASPGDGSASSSPAPSDGRRSRRSKRE
jgi:hypothetical protein